MIFMKRKCLCMRVKLLKPGPVVMEPPDFSGNTVRDFKQAHIHINLHTCCTNMHLFIAMNRDLLLLLFD